MIKTKEIIKIKSSISLYDPHMKYQKNIEKISNILLHLKFFSLFGDCNTYAYIIHMHGCWIYTRHALHLSNAVVVRGTLANLTLIRLSSQGDSFRKYTCEFFDRGRFLEA